MILNRIILAASVEYVPISSRPTRTKSQIRAEKKSAMHPTRISTGLQNRFNRCEMLTAATPTRVDMVVVSSVGMKMSVGWTAPICARYIMMLTGISINPDVFITRNIIIGFVAVSFSDSVPEVLSWLLVLKA